MLSLIRNLWDGTNKKQKQSSCKLLQMEILEDRTVPTVISLDFDTRPIAQGWNFVSGNRSEASIFSVDGTKLSMNSIGSGLRPAQAYHRYEYPGVIDPAKPFTISLTARVLQAEAFDANFGFGAYMGNQATLINIGPSRVINPATGGQLLSLTATQFHNYRLEVTPGIGTELLIDGIRITSIPFANYNNSNRLYFGDDTMDGNSRVEITNYVFAQDLPDIHMQTAQLLNGNTVQFIWEKTGNTGSFDVGLYRSTDGIMYNPIDDLIATTSITPSSMDPQGPGIFTLSSYWNPDPAKPFLVVVADPDDLITETNPNNNKASLQLPDIAILTAKLESPQATNFLQFTYQLNGDLGRFQVGVYRSSDANFDANDLQVGQLQTITPSLSGGIQHDRITLTSEIPIDPSRQFILVVADPNNLIVESNEANNDDGNFRKLALAVVTHGYELDGLAPSWMTDMESKLKQQGYDRTILFDWANLSNVMVEGRTIFAGQEMASEIRQKALQMNTELAMGANDVIDLHLIGHSRGAVVISQALLELQSNPGPLSLQLGYFMMTMLDPHPARNRGTGTEQEKLREGLAELFIGTGISTIGGFYFAPFTPLSLVPAIKALRMQMRMQDPEIVISANVDYSESFWQQSVTAFNLPTIFNLWGIQPSLIQNPSNAQFHSYYLPQEWGIGHTGMAEWYLNNIL